MSILLTKRAKKRPTEVALVGPETPPAKRVKRFSTFHELRRTVVTVKVGPEAYPFILYKELLCSASGFFRKALDRSEKYSGSFKETEEQCISLPEEDVETFKLFHLWLEKDDLPLVRLKHSNQLSTQESLDLYVFADRHDVRGLRNAAIKHLIEWNHMCGLVPSAQEISDVWEQLQPNSLLSKYLVQEYALYRSFAVKDAEHVGCLPQDFLLRVLMVTLETLRLQPGAVNLIQKSAFTSATEALTTTQQFPKELLVNMVVLNMQLLGTLEDMGCNDALYKFVKPRVHMCSYHEHDTAEERENCAYQMTRIWGLDHI